MHANNANATYGNWTPYNLYSKVLPLTKASCDATAKRAKHPAQVLTSNATTILGNATHILYLLSQY